MHNKKTFLIVCPDESFIKAGKNCRQTHYDLSVLRFFDSLNTEKNARLHFLKTDMVTMKDSGVDIIKNYLNLKNHCHLTFDVVLSYPGCREIEEYSKEKGILYYAFDHLGQGSKYLDYFWMFNTKAIREFEKFDSKNSDCSNVLSPLSNEACNYHRFMPLGNKGADIFYNNKRMVCLVLIDESIQRKNEKELIGQLRATLNDHAFLFSKKADLVLYGKSKTILAGIKADLRGEKTVSVNTIHDHFRFSEYSVYSMIHKSDLIFSWGSHFGMDALVFKKPVIFIGTDHYLFKRLNVFVEDCGESYDLPQIGRSQHEYLSRFVSGIKKKGLVFPNVWCDSNQFYGCLVRACFSETGKKNDPGVDDLFRESKINEIKRVIVPEYVDPALQAKRVFKEYQKKIQIMKKRYKKLQNDPHAFCRDSRYSLLRWIGSCL